MLTSRGGLTFIDSKADRKHAHCSQKRHIETPKGYTDNWGYSCPQLGCLEVMLHILWLKGVMRRFHILSLRIFNSQPEMYMSIVILFRDHLKWFGLFYFTIEIAKQLHHQERYISISNGFVAFGGSVSDNIKRIHFVFVYPYRKCQDYVYIKWEYLSTMYKIKH